MCQYCIPFCGWTVLRCTDASHLLPPLIHWWTFGSFHFSNAAVKIVCNRFWVDACFSFSWVYTKSGIVGSSSNSMFNHVDCQSTVSKKRGGRGHGALGISLVGLCVSFQGLLWLMTTLGGGTTEMCSPQFSSPEACMQGVGRAFWRLWGRHHPKPLSYLWELLAVLSIPCFADHHSSFCIHLYMTFFVSPFLFS